MARRKDPQTGKLLPEGIYPIVSDRTGIVTYRARTHFSIGTRRKHLSKVFKSAQAAIDWKLETDLKMNRGQFIEPSRLTVDQYFNQWVERQKKDWSGSRYLIVEQFWRIHAKPIIGDLKMQEVTKAHIQHLADTMLLTMKASSANTYLAAARTMFKHAEDDEVIQRSPYRSIRLSPVDESEQLTWSPLQLRLFLQKTRDHEYGPLWAFMVATGCRVGEAIALKPDALDLKAGTAHIKRTEAVDTDKRRKIFDRTKGKKKRHIVRLEPWIVEILAALPKGPYVFMVEGQRTSYHAVSRAFARERDRLQLPRITLHGLRHSVVTMLRAAGVGIEVVRSITGHASGAMVQEYTQISTDDQQAGTQTAAKLLGFDATDTTTSSGDGRQNEGNASEVRQN